MPIPKRADATPYGVVVAPRVCNCKLPGKDLGTFKRAERAVKEIEGYWNVYIGFFGDQMMWLDFTVIDLRDGTVVWRNGRLMKEEDIATTDATEGNRGTAGRSARAGQWIGAGRHAHGW